MSTIKNNMIPPELKEVLQVGLKICLDAAKYQNKEKKIDVYVRETEMKYVIVNLLNLAITQTNGNIETEVENFLKEYLGIPSSEFSKIINNSKLCTIEFGDHINHHTCRKTWKNYSELDPSITHDVYYGSTSYFSISFEPDFVKLRYTHLFIYIHNYMFDHCNEIDNVKFN